MKLNEKLNLKNEVSIKKALEYSEDVEKMQNILEKIEVFATFKGLTKKWNDSDVATFEIEVKKDGKKIIFDFYQSINFTEYFMTEVGFQNEYKVGKNFIKREKIVKEKKEQMNDFLYSVLCCIKTDGYIPDNFEDFCLEFGYNEDSIKDFNLFNECIKQKKNISKIFAITELEFFPS